MKKKIPRMVAFLLALVLTAGIATPASAAPDTFITVNGQEYHVGNLIYDYDQIPANMKYNFVINALQYIGYDAHFLMAQKQLFNTEYFGSITLESGDVVAAMSILEQETGHQILSYIPYKQGTGVVGHTIRPATDGEKTKTGNVPDVAALLNAGMACTSFIEYAYFGYARNVEGPDVEQLLYCYQEALRHVPTSGRWDSAGAMYPDLWTDAMEGTGGAVEKGIVTKFTSTLQDSKEQSDAFRKILEQIRAGTMIRFGRDDDPYVHWAIYIGTYNNQHYVAHMGSSRGPEISTIEEIAARKDGKHSYPLAFYDLKLGKQYGNIQVIKTDSADGSPLAGAKFEIRNRETNEVKLVGPTNEAGVAILSGLPLGTYSVREITAPDGYTMSKEVKVVTLTAENPVPDPLIFGNTKEDAAGTPVGSLQINKNTSTGADKGGWQFQLYNNRYWHSAALDASTSGHQFRVMVMDKYGNVVISKPATQTYAPLAEANDTDYIQITKQLPTYTRINSGGGLNFKVEATGTNLSYRWQYSDDGGTTWSNYSSSYNTNRFLVNSTSSNIFGRMIRLRITDGEGHRVFSTPTTVVLRSALLVTEQPKNASALFERSASFTVAAESSQTIKYQWQFSTDGGTTWVNCDTSNHYNGSSGFANATLTISTYDAPRSETLYRCAVSDTDETVYSEPATLQTLAAEINSQPQDYIGKLGDSVTFTVGYTNTSLDLDWVWEYSTDGGETWIEAARTGFTPSLTVELTKETHGRLYRAKVSNNHATNYTEAAVLREEGGLYIYEQPKNVNAIVTGDAIFYVEAEGEGLCYIWQVSTDGGESWEDVTKPIGTYTVDDEGKYQINGLASGPYFVWEVNDQRDGWIYDLTPKAVTVFAENTAQNPAIVTFYNEKEIPQPTTGSITIHKETTNGGRKDGWLFYLTKDNQIYASGVTDGNGTLVFSNLAPGTYAVIEMGRMDMNTAYWIMAESQAVTVVVGVDKPLTFENQYVGIVTITKTYADGSSPVGTMFKITDGINTLGIYTVKNENGIINLGQMQPGIYYVEEILPDGSIYKPENGVLQRFTVVAGETTNVTFVNVLAVGHVSVTKNAVNGSAEGLMIHIIDAQSHKGTDAVTNENGVMILEHLQPGTYSVKEIGHKTMTEEQLSYWQMDLDAKPVTVVAGETASTTITNTQLGKLIVNIAMEDGTSPEGWQFTAVDANGDPIPGSTFTVDASGTYPVGLLLPGTYTVTELIPDGSLYACKSENPQTVQITAGETTIISFVNNLRPGTITIHKTNGDGEPLSGAKILLEWLDNDVWKPVVYSDTVIPGGCSAADLTDGWLISDEEGLLIFTGLHPGVQYRLTELEAPQGYVKLTESVVIGKLDIETLAHEHQIINEPGYPPPQTGTQESLSFLLLLSTPILAIFGVAMATNGTKLFNYGKNSRK